MPFTCKIGTETFHSDTVTFGELEALEDVLGSPWVLLNPLRSVRDAKALLAIFLVRAGRAQTNEEALAEIEETLLAGHLGRIFGFADELDDLPPLPWETAPAAEVTAPAEVKE